MRSFFSLHNKHKEEKGKPGEQRMLSFLKIEADTLSPCFQRLAYYKSSSSSKPYILTNGVGYMNLISYSAWFEVISL